MQEIHFAEKSNPPIFDIQHQGFLCLCYKNTITIDTKFLGPVLRLLSCKKSDPGVQKTGPDFALKKKNKTYFSA